MRRERPVVTVARRKEPQKLSQQDTQEKKKAILAALAKASEESLFLKNSADALDAEPQGYYTLSRDEVEALVNGDMKKIESWVSNMDRSHATRLLRWLIKERW
jgi:outer membrane PBP1 activator LpoA protein